MNNIRNKLVLVQILQRRRLSLLLLVRCSKVFICFILSGLFFFVVVIVFGYHLSELFNDVNIRLKPLFNTNLNPRQGFFETLYQFLI